MTSPRLILSILLGLCGSTLVNAAAAQATTVTVTTTADGGVGSLRDALAIATSGDIIDASGVSGTITLTTGELLVTKSLTIIGPGPATLGVDAHGASRVFHIAPNTVVVISGLTVTNGHDAGFLPGGGGGILNDHASLTVINCTLHGNTALFDGGGILNAGEQGGGPARLRIVDSTLTGNSALAGGALLNNGSAGHASAEITNSTLSGNTASAGNAGGAIYNAGNAAMRIVRSTLSGNSANGGGGGIYNQGVDASIEIVDSTMSGNSAGDLGGVLVNVAIDGGHASAVAIVNSTLSGNTAGFLGGAIYNLGADGGNASVNIINSTLSENSVANNVGGITVGGGVFNDRNGNGTVRLLNTILAGNTAVPSADCFGVITSLGHNLIGDQTGCTITLQPTDVTGGPALEAFADDGTPGNGHFPLLPTSQAIDAGDPDACPETDQLGQLRIGPCDIGAIEFQSSVPVDTRPPAITVTATPMTLWPPNGKLVTITVSGTIIDESFGSGVDLESAVYAVTDEYGQIEPSGTLTLEANSYILTVSLEASRRGKDGDGRHYAITVSASDNTGNVGRAATTVTVPHDQGQ